ESRLDPLAYAGEQLRLLDVGLRRRERLPRLRVERHLPATPGAAAHLHGRLQERELVRPRLEAALAAEIVEPPEDRHRRVARRLLREVVELARGELREHAAAAEDLEAR